MKESGLFDTSEKLEVIPKTYIIERQKRVKYSFSKCYSAIFNSPAIPRIIPTSNYGDSLVKDATLSKYCDLIPMERYAAMAGREGVLNLPPQSLIGLTHDNANLFAPVVLKIRNEVLSNRVVLADEILQEILEGDDTKNWFSWGFFSYRACYFEAHNTRSGDVVKKFMKESQAKYLLSDGYAGYRKAIKEICKEFNRQIIESFCNSHAFRYFKDAIINWQNETEIFLTLYKEIYE